MKPIAIVIPWYGDNIRGGAENEANYLAHIFNEYGKDVEVFTTCVATASDPRGVNTLKPGEYNEGGILVRRFPVKTQKLDEYIGANSKIYNSLEYTLTDEKIYFEEDINSPEMCKYINMHKDDYKAFLFMPYLYGITYNGSKSCPENCFMIPCFHDEPYIHMSLVKEMAERMKGIIYLSQPEKRLANKLFDLSEIPNEVLGAGVDDGWEFDLHPESFRQKYNINGPFILYAGRKDSGKKADVLVDYFIKFVKRNPEYDLKLLLIGGGSIEIAPQMKKYIMDLGFLSVEDKHNAFAAAEVFCNPSWFESFSIVIMESWLAKRPVMVASQCSVTKNFCIETGGGLYFSDFYDFEESLLLLINNRKLAKQMGENGFEYVQENFTKKHIAEKYLDFINSVIDGKY